MMKFARHELGPLDERYRCRRAGCEQPVATIGTGNNCSGFALPFCPTHLGNISRSTFHMLCDAAGGSVFDIDAVATAAALVASARFQLREKPHKLAKRVKRA